MNRLTLVKDLGTRPCGNKGNTIRWGLYKCICGKEKEIRTCDVNRGVTVSCGCYNNEKLIKRNTKHGLSKTDLYVVWLEIVRRCTKVEKYKDYAGRGIRLCDEWFDFVEFFKWSNLNCYKKGLQIDRIDNDGNYEPSNCHFVTSAENCAVGKRRKSKKNKSGYTGVTWNKKYGKWYVQIGIESTSKFIGSFNNIDNAVQARISKEIELFGEQRTNFHFVKEVRK